MPQTLNISFKSKFFYYIILEKDKGPSKPDPKANQKKGPQKKWTSSYLYASSHINNLNTLHRITHLVFSRGYYHCHHLIIIIIINRFINWCTFISHLNDCVIRNNIKNYTDITKTLLIYIIFLLYTFWFLLGEHHI